MPKKSLTKKAVRRADRSARRPPIHQRRQFRMHHKLLFDVILRQAGTLAKAILEGVMNAVDADAQKCEIHVGPKQVRISDDGRGFRSYEEVTTWFEVFGQPHEESEKKTFGRFRMGRGQLFAYGKNTWLTNGLQMQCDCKHRGLDYEVKALEPAVPGCTVLVDLYEPLVPSEIEETVRSLKIWCRWAPVQVVLNDEVISRDPREFEWSEETDDAWIGLDESPQLRIYNQGIFVLEYSKHRFGVGGEVVSKREIKVNFARNEIQSDCPVWRRLRPFIDQRGRERSVSKRTLDDAQRTSLRLRAKRGQLSCEEIRKLKLFTAVTGRHYNLAQVADRSYNGKLTTAPRGDRLGDHVHQARLAFVLAEEVIKEMGFADAAAFVRWGNRLRADGEFGGKCQLWLSNRTYVPFEDIAKGMDLTFEIVPEAKYTVNEKAWMSLLNGIRHRLLLTDEDKHDWRNASKFANSRKILVGRSEAADGWTDAKTYVAVNRKFLQTCPLTVDGMVRAADLLLHEFCHREPDTEDHDHDHEFYQLYHDSLERFMTVFLRHAIQLLPRCLKKLGKQLTKAQLHLADQLALAEYGKQELNEKIAAKAASGEE
ncbi:MAG: ATP-binding protein [Planctomycetes bacterium]|nr:ATP-binding protein [Planctomycetota bacterium]